MREMSLVASGEKPRGEVERLKEIERGRWRSCGGKGGIDIGEY